MSQFGEWLQQGERIIFFGGAGVSTESGIPDFRSADGLFREGGAAAPETILSHGYFLSHTAEFYRFYRERMVHPEAQPNEAHRALARLEKLGKLRAVVTQNIDGLHQAAGSSMVLELHGSIHRNFCMACGAFYPMEEVLHGEEVPHCTCGSLIKPDVVLYGEALDEDLMARAVRMIREADVLIVGGSSLAVHPAAGLVRHYQGDRLVLINKTETPYDRYANLILREPIGALFARTMREIGIE